LPDCAGVQPILPCAVLSIWFTEETSTNRFKLRDQRERRGSLKKPLPPANRRTKALDESCPQLAGQAGLILLFAEKSASSPEQAAMSNI
jgi:hypothetical protein